MKLAKLTEKLEAVVEHYQNLNRHDFSGSWDDRIRWNTYGEGEEYHKNVAKKLRHKDTVNRRLNKRIADLEAKIAALKVG